MKYSEFKEIANKNHFKICGDTPYYLSVERRYANRTCQIMIHKLIGEQMNVYGKYRDDDITVLIAAIELAKTPFERRYEEKRYIIPLPKLCTTDGEQQYLTHKYHTFFACRRDENLQQIWKEEDLGCIPNEYREYAKEVENEI